MENMTLDVLNLTVAPARVGALTATVQRELTAEDMVTLATVSLNGGFKTLQKVRTIHHTIARLLASGMKAVDVSVMTGFSPNRITDLASRDPMFQELVAHYAGQEDARFADVRDRMAQLGVDAADILLHRIDNDPESIGTDQLRQILVSALDRGGHAPVQRSQSLNVNLSAEELMKIKQASNESTVIKDKGGARPPVGDSGAIGAAGIEASTGAGEEGQGPRLRAEIREVPEEDSGG